MLGSIEVGELASGGGKAEPAAAGALACAVGLQARRPPQRQGRPAETRARPWDPPARESCR
jgi:hypothetical protein